MMSCLAIKRELVKVIPLGLVQRPDFLAWFYDEKGEYTVKSGYYSLVRERITTLSSSRSIIPKWWKQVWGEKIPPKIKSLLELFLLSLKLHVVNYRSQIVVWCVVVRIFHALFLCDATESVWKIVGL